MQDDEGHSHANEHTVGRVSVPSTVAGIRCGGAYSAGHAGAIPGTIPWRVLAEASDVTERVNHIADALGLQVVEQLAGGYFGAFHTHTTAGACAVLKVLPAWPELALDKVRWEGARAGDSRADLLRVYAVAATWERADSAVVALLRKELDDTTPPDVRLPIGAEIAVEHLRYTLFARPSEMEWVLREARILLSEAG